MSMRLVGMTGVHGTGKTTVMEALKDGSFNVTIPKYESLPRKVQRERGMTMQSVETASFEDIMAYQEAILAELKVRDINLQLEHTGVVFVDRSPIDLAGYTLLWTSHFDTPEQQARIARYVEACVDQVLLNYAAIVFFPIRAEIPFVPEAQRASLKTRGDLDRYMRLVSARCRREALINFGEVQTLDALERAAECVTIATATSNNTVLPGTVFADTNPEEGVGLGLDSEAYNEGYAAFEREGESAVCEYPMGTEEWTDWTTGYNVAIIESTETNSFLAEVLLGIEKTRRAQLKRFNKRKAQRRARTGRR